MLYKLICFLFISFIAACSTDWDHEWECIEGCDSKTEESVDENTTTRVVYVQVPGPQGPAGQDGKNGSNGKNGVNGQDGMDGADGQDGADGVNGTDGQDGYSSVMSVFDAGEMCAFGGSIVFSAQDSNKSGALELEQDSNIMSFIICNGQDGMNGADGQDGADGADGQDGESFPVEVIDPCGDTAGIIDEVLLRMPDGSILASISQSPNGKNTRLSILPSGNYITTDGSSCVFSIDENGNIID